jgi:hypothetical protein
MVLAVSYAKSFSAPQSIKGGGIDVRVASRGRVLGVDQIFESPSKPAGVAVLTEEYHSREIGCSSQDRERLNSRSVSSTS